MNNKYKRIFGLVLILVLVSSNYTVGHAAYEGPGGSGYEDEFRGIWISYQEWEKLPSDEAGFEREVDRLLDNCVGYGMNTVIVHVRPYSDAMYPSEIFPWSKYLTGEQGKDPGYDPLKYFIDAAHQRNLDFHAWVNPYRVTGYLNRWGDLSEDNPAFKWLTDANPENDRWVLKHSGEYYYNPAVPEVRRLIIEGVEELVWNYDIDGILFDDYFYPSVNDSRADLSFDKPEYDDGNSRLTIANWRRNNVNLLVRGVYAAIKDISEAVQFGVSPEGYIPDLKSNSRLFVDIDTWMSQSGYLDYVIPQIYWGFEAKTKDGKPAPYAFEQNVKTWIDQQKKGNVTLYLGLAMYKTATNASDNNSVSEWLRYSNMMQRQVESGRRNKQVSGFCFYSYESFTRNAAQTEVINLKKVLQ